MVLSIPTGLTERGVSAILDSLNGPSAPSWRDSVAHADHRGKLPDWWKLSFGRVARGALHGDPALLERLMAAFGEFEEACGALMDDEGDYEVWAPYIFGGTPASLSTYLDDAPRKPPFSVRRLDIVVGKTGAAYVTENDDMPAGLYEAFLLDRAYGVNQQRWKRALDSLTRNGMLVFVVSHLWSSVYIQGLTWLAREWSLLGYPAAVVTTDNLSQLKQEKDGLYYQPGGEERKVGTLWRYFPLFEIDNELFQLIKFADTGKVRLVPEVTSWGNKAWLGIFWKYQDHFQRTMGTESLEILRQAIPPASVAQNQFDFPQSFGSYQIESYEQLLTLKGEELGRVRSATVAKVAGATEMSARCYGVAIGNNKKRPSEWRAAVESIFSAGAPVLFQEYRSPGRFDLPVISALQGKILTEERMPCRILLRPWSIDGPLVSVTAVCCPLDMSNLHAAISASLVPLDLG